MNNNNIIVPDIQRALVLQGGGALGAYEAGVLEVLCQRLYEEDKENKREDSLLFDIVAGTSIGATNGAILVSQFLKTRNWVKAADKLHKFWTNQSCLKSNYMSHYSYKQCCLILICLKWDNLNFHYY
ncbi:MAG TPA: patatin-like phospholipase family protein [Nitrososphaeraceae archaeon]|nr:patatin-like phospholipase family protein [Nitrososphaeraceae archaeon]